MAQRDSEKYGELLTAFEDAWGVSTEFCEPYFELAIRLYKLWRGKLPPELDSTYTKVNINLANATVSDLMPKHSQTIFADPNLVSLEATEPIYELYKEQTQMWLRDLLVRKMNMRYSLNPTLLDVEVIGTGYRRPTVIWEGSKAKITSRHADFFSVLPGPNGGLVNPDDWQQGAAVDWDFYQDWMTVDYLENMGKKGKFDKEQTEKFLASKPNDESWVDTYRDQFGTTVDNVMRDGPSSWRNKIIGKKGLPQRRRVRYWERRDKVTIIGDEQYVLYDGPPLLMDGIIPTVKYTAVPDGTNWMGISALELIEDAILAVVLNLNLRLQHLIQTMFPIKWIRQDIVGAHSRASFDSMDPNQTVAFPDSVDDIRKAVFYDRATEVPQQAFLEDSALKFFIQEVGGVTNFSKGMGGAGSLSNDTATGITTLISQASARFLAQAEQLEYGGLRDECKMLLRLGKKYVTEATPVKDMNDPFGWTMVDADDICDAYNIKTHGTAYLTDRRETMQKMLAWSPVLLNHPELVDTQQVLRQGTELMDAYPEPDKLFLKGAPPAPPVPPQQGAGQGTPAMGGLASPLDITQQTRGTANRSTVKAGGNVVPAGFGA